MIFNKSIIVSAILMALSVSNAQAGDADKFDFNFEMSGPKSALPVQSFTDGKSTWLQFRNLDNLPAIFSRGAPLRYKIEAPYIVIEGVHQSFTIVTDSGDTVGEVNYFGRYASGGSATSFKVAKPVAINSTAPMPTEVVEVKPYERIAPLERNEIIVTQAETKILVTPTASAQAPQQAVVEQVNAKTFNMTMQVEETKPVAEIKPSSIPVKKSGQRLVLSTEPINGDKVVSDTVEITQKDQMFFPRGYPVTADKVLSIVDFVNSGGRIKIFGKSGSVEESARIKWAAIRANELRLKLIQFGVPESMIQVVPLTAYPAKGDKPGASVAFVERVSS